MKKIITGALALLLLAGAAQAQTSDVKQHHKHGKHHGWMKQLNLTTDQQAQLKSLHSQQRQEMDALKSNTALTPDQLKAKREEIHRKYAGQAQSLYTPEQKQQIEKMKADWKSKDHNGAKDGRAAGRRFAEQLNLTQDQKDRLHKMKADAKTQFEAVRNDNNLSQDQKKAKFRELHQQQHEQMKTVLTKEQVEKMESLRKERMPKSTK